MSPCCCSTSKAKLEISLRHWDVQFWGICATPEGKLVVFRVARVTLCSLLCFVPAGLSVRCFLRDAHFSLMPLTTVLLDCPSLPVFSLDQLGIMGLKIFISQTSVSQHLTPKAKTIPLDYLSCTEHSSSTGCFSRFTTGNPTGSSK